MRYKPANYPDISAYAVLADPEASMVFIEALFGGERLRLIRDDQGRIVHGEIRVGEAVLMMGGSAEGWLPQELNLHYYVEDVDAVYRRALELGAISVQPPIQKDDPDKRGGFKDPGGIVWWVATQTEAD